MKRVIMKKKLLVLSLAALLCSTSGKAQLASNPDKFLGNITTSGQVDFGNEKFHTLWNQITCENESKWESVEGTNNNFNWGGCDNARNYAKSHNFPFKYHALVWGSQYPKWLEQMTPEQRYKEIVQWMDKIKERYPDLQMIDVVNEAVSGHQAGTKYFIEALGGPGLSGYDWIVKAFELAYERWPNAILIYNDFNTFQWNTDQYIDLVKAIRNAGAPIDAYGCQSHDLTDCNFTTFKNSMAKLQNALKMPMYSTEYDIGTSDDKVQLQRYKEQIPYMWESDYVAGITLWGYIYGRTWTTDGNSGIIKNGVDRPAMTWLREYMQTDAAKKAKSPFPGMVKEASVYVKPECINVERDRETKITVRAKMRTKTIEKVELYVKGELAATMTEAPYVATFTPTTTGTHDLKAVVTCTDGTKYERHSSIMAYSQRTAFKETPTELPGILEAENFDIGGPGISHFDNNSKKEGTGSAYRSDVTGADVEKGGTGYVLGYTQVGEWVEYTVNVKEAGIYAINMSYSAPEAGASFNLSLNTPDGLKTLTEKTVVVPATYDWSKFQTAYSKCLIPLEKGEQIIRLTFTGGPDYVMNVDNISFEHLNINENIDISIANDSDDEIGNAGIESSFTASVSADKDIKDVKFYIDGVLTKTATEVPYQLTYIPEATGKYKIIAVATDVDGNVSEEASYIHTVKPHRLPFRAELPEVPGVIEAENFDRGGEGLTFHDTDAKDDYKCGYRGDNGGVDIMKTANGGYAIAKAQADEWYEYTINVTKSVRFLCEGTASSDVDESAFRVGIVRNGEVTYYWTINVPKTGANNFTAIKAASKRKLPEGTNIIRILVSKGNCNIDKIAFLPGDADAIETISADDDTTPTGTYSITGQRVGDNYKGILIKNGKKVVIK